MEGRMDRMEVDLTALKADVAAMRCDVNTLNIDMAVVKANYATKTDVLEARHSIVMWIVSAILLAQLLPPVLRKFGL
jgi:hypothetical protein